MKASWATMLLCVLLALEVCAQEQDLRAELTVQHFGDGIVAITGTARDRRPSPQPFSYSMHVWKADSPQQLIVRQAGEIIAESQAVHTLATSNLKIPATSAVHVTLQLYAQQQLLDADTLVLDLASLSQEETLLQKASAKTNTAEFLKAALQSASLEEETKPDPTTEGLEIEGLIIDDTRSKIGRDFYDFFYTTWQQQEQVGSYSIVVREYPARGRIIQVGIELNGEVILKPFLQPRPEILENVAQQCVTVVRQQLSQQKQINKQLASPDQAGSGLF